MIRRPTRRGFTLIEMLTVIVGVTMILGLAVAVLEGLFQAERAGRRDAVADAEMDRMARSFRADVHAAKGSGPMSDDRLEITFADAGKVGYEARGETVVVTRLPAGAANPRTESFRPRRGWKPRFEIIEWEGEKLIALVLVRDGGVEARRVEAALGRDRVLNSGEEQAKP